jgi:UDP-N-acetylmuramoyl-tripeptide--D-alanyl-D-alanine ligase
MEISEIIEVMKPLTHIFLVMALGFYLITNLQWYNYKIERVLTKHHKPFWHFLYFAIPFALYFFGGDFFLIFFYFAYLPSLYIWHKRLDKKLVVTSRVKRFLFLLFFLTVYQDIICAMKESCGEFGIILPLLLTLIGSYLTEKVVFLSFRKSAENKLRNMHNLKIIAITGSYGKTSIKNFLFQTLSRKYKVQATPRSVNTLSGIVKDINENLQSNTEIYLVEAGAREKGDILEITQLLQHQFAVIGKIGEQHIEYFKSLEKIAETKLELLQSQNLIKSYLHTTARDYIYGNEFPFKVDFFGENLENIVADINGTDFSLQFDGNDIRFQTELLGGFVAENIHSVIKVALDFGFSIDEVRKAVLKLEPVSNRLQKIKAGGKIILDDGYNSNFDGMKEAFRIVESSRGRKVVVTPGLVESNEETNKAIAKEIDRIFGLVIITGSLNRYLFKNELKNPKAVRIFLEDKSKLEDILSKHTKSGDIILFANDAPNFI